MAQIFELVGISTLQTLQMVFFFDTFCRYNWFSARNSAFYNKFDRNYAKTSL